MHTKQDAFLQATKARMSTYDAYVDLYKDMVGYGLGETPSDVWPRVHALRDYIEIFETNSHRRKSAEYPAVQHDYDYVFVNTSLPDWTYVHANYKEQNCGYRKYVKLYVPVSFEKMPEVARAIFDILFNFRQDFCFKFAYNDRRDNICLWILPEMLDEVIDDLERFKEFILPSPLFVPVYREFGITRELSGSYNQVIAVTLFDYLAKNDDVSFSGYCDFVYKIIEHADDDDYFSAYEMRGAFDAGIVRRSLQLLLTLRCPVKDPEIGIVDFDKEV